LEEAMGESKENLEKVYEVDTLERLATGFQFTEGPVWHPDGYLLFSDIPANQIVRWETGKETSVFREPSHNSNGMTYDNEGNLVVCEHGSRTVTRTLSDGTIEVLAKEYQGKRLNSPNDVVVAKSGRVYFTDPPYGVQKEDRELDFSGVYSIDSDGTLHLENRDLSKPNGLALSPDESVLYVADTEGTGIQAFPVGSEGWLGKPSLFGEPGLKGGDGMKVDKDGNVLATGKGGIWTWDKDGNWIGLLKTPEEPANCAFGGADGKTFFIAARKSLYQVRVKTPGILPMGK
jgi:sugar lactone lactonase YvrE